MVSLGGRTEEEEAAAGFHPVGSDGSQFVMLQTETVLLRFLPARIISVYRFIFAHFMFILLFYETVQRLLVKRTISFMH